jgi:hypothetical protein
VNYVVLQQFAALPAATSAVTGDIPPRSIVPPTDCSGDLCQHVVEIERRCRHVRLLSSLGEQPDSVSRGLTCSYNKLLGYASSSDPKTFVRIDVNIFCPDWGSTLPKQPASTNTCPHEWLYLDGRCACCSPEVPSDISPGTNALPPPCLALWRRLELHDRTYDHHDNDNNDGPECEHSDPRSLVLE